MEEVERILRHYDLGDQEMLNYESHSHDPDMWSHTFEVNNKKYLLVEVEAVDDDLQAEEYERLEDDLHIKRGVLKLVTPKLEQIHTMNNRGGIGIDGHSGVINADDRELKKYKNPYGLRSETAWVLFELV